MITRDPRSLKLHPLFAKLPPPDYETITETNDPDKQKARDAAWGSFIDNMRDEGPDTVAPLIITGDLVIDGRRRLKAARALQWKEIRCVEVPKERAAAVAFGAG